MHDELKKLLGRNNMADDDIEFYSFGLMAMLQGQQKIKGIPLPLFKRKFTALFRLYEPLVQAMYDRPVQLLDTYLLWENNFFRKIPLVHHRDQARVENKLDIVQLADSDPEEVEDIVMERADKLFDKLQQQRIKAEEAKAKRQNSKKSQKASTSFQWDPEDNQILLTCSMTVRGLTVSEVLRSIVTNTLQLIETI